MTIHKHQPLPTWRDLPVDDGVPMDNRKHPVQAVTYLWRPLQRYLDEHGMTAFICHNAFVYYEVGKAGKGPDFCVVNGGVDKGQGSWVIFSENDLPPTLIIELLSPSTEDSDRHEKRLFYQEIFKLPDYFVYDTDDHRFEGWQLVDGVSRPVRVLPNGRVPCISLPLLLGVHHGWLRWFTRDGKLLKTDGELLTEARRREARLRREAERQAQAAAAEIAGLRRELDRLTGELADDPSR